MFHNQKPDAEVQAMVTALNLLSGLQPEEQKRVLVWISEKLNLVGIMSTRNQQPPHVETPPVAQSSVPGLAGIRFPVGTTIDKVERELIFQTLSATNQNKTQTAKLLGISLKTLHNKLNKYKAGQRNT